MVSKQTAKNIDIGIAVLLFISLFTTDWDWLLAGGSLNNIILMVVIGGYTLFISIAVIITYLAYNKDEETAIAKPVSPDTMNSIKMAFFIALFGGVVLILYSQIAFRPGEGLFFNILGTVCLIVAIVLSLVLKNMQKRLNMSG